MHCNNSDVVLRAHLYDIKMHKDVNKCKDSEVHNGPQYIK
jgi:hypothetical protein